VQVTAVAIGDLVPYPGNARTHNLDAIADSLTVNGQYMPIVVQRSTKHVLRGNGTLEAARDKLGWSKLNVLWADVDDEAARRIVLGDNRTSDLAGYDDEALVALLKPFDGDLAGTAFSQDDLEDLLAAANQVAVSPPEEFHGDFNEDLAETERRRNTGVALATQGYREVILILRQEQLEGFTARVAALQKTWGTTSTTATVLEALERSQP
jgi:hypothetical protein